jgi:hypothetical protein
MVEYLRHYAAAFILFAVLVTLYVNVYTDVEDAYNLTRTDTDSSNRNIMEALEDLNIISSMNDLSTAIYKIANPQNAADILGAMALADWGVLKTIAAIVLLPIEILGVITGFYYIPSIVPTGLVIMSFIYVAFILVSAWLKEKI